MTAIVFGLFNYRIFSYTATFDPIEIGTTKLMEFCVIEAELTDLHVLPLSIETCVCGAIVGTAI